MENLYFSPFNFGQFQFKRCDDQGVGKWTQCSCVQATIIQRLERNIQQVIALHNLICAVVEAFVVVCAFVENRFWKGLLPVIWLEVKVTQNILLLHPFGTNNELYIVKWVIAPTYHQTRQFVGQRQISKIEIKTKLSNKISNYFC